MSECSNAAMQKLHILTSYSEIYAQIEKSKATFNLYLSILPTLASDSANKSEEKTYDD